ncbi:ectonucleoside triphosphate diphosphohydrolase 1 [Sceloporus undulatus]|uniref:ectonucleoside triphosphate diphosphohydrolase 1 n=1 Tax=Sceloporus undulatus TaxID=8520 RepID=UPI001C4BCF26|nr:ectonucleoside triphosphate diphosphohydrolase 1 [Sceloporus undulatus]
MDRPKGSKLWKCFRPKYIITGFLLAGAVIALIAVAVTQNHHSSRNSKYGIVLDAGSSHTNMYVYKWPAEKENDTGVVQQVAVCEVEGPGISAYASEVGKAGPSLKHCMDEAKEIVPQTKHNETPVYLGATAGMRLLSMEDAGTAKDVLSGVEATLRSYPFRFQGARILSGEEEGAYGWITLNYLLGNFKESIWPSFLPRIFSRTGTTGALDLGGASTQITFVPDQKKNESSEYMVNFYLYGKTYTVYTHSFLCYGKDQALRLKMLNDVLHSSTSTVQDPCFQQGYERTVNIVDLRTNPCTASNFKAPLYSTLHIEGTGNYEMCLTSIKNIFSIVGCPYSSCSFNGTFLPQVSGEFGAFSAFYYVMNFLNVTEESMDKVAEALKTFCSKSWVKVKADFPKIKEKYLSEYCFAGTYIISLLNQRYNFTKEKWTHIRFLGKIGESDAGWTLGYMLNLTNMIPAEQPYIRPLSHANYITLMAVCSIMVVSLLFVAYMIYRKPKCLKKEII